ncbi:hypothetical protein [Streptomyces massasporeus]|uniref:hypothetical protein n=1 Tax=Streptomyces massasporeus TaxID=67324 RepID=UPI003676DBAB
MTALLTLYVVGYAYTAAGREGTPSVVGGGATGYALGLALNALLLAGALLAWWAGGRLWPARRSAREPVRPRRPATPLAVVLVVVMLLLAAANMLMLAVAVAGLLLGTSAFLAQAVVAVLLMPLFVRGLSGRDRVLLGIGQQNGLTAVLLALTLERDFPKTVGIVAPAVVTVNLLYYRAQTLFGCWSRHRAGKNRRPAAPEQSLPRRQAAGEGRRGEVPPTADGLRSSA